MASNLILIRHGDEPEDDRVTAFAAARGFAARVLRPFKGDPLPDPGPDTAGAVVFGGPFAVYEEERFPFLTEEARFIRACLARDLPLLGICQGAQQIARVLGAHVGPPPGGHHEFGYYPITPTEEGRDIMPGTLWLAQSHYHTFAIPEGAVHLASSPDYPNQAFRWGARTYGFQFHAECTRAGFRRWQEAPWAAYGKPGAQDRATQDHLGAAHDAAQGAWFEGFLDRLFGWPG